MFRESFNDYLTGKINVDEYKLQRIISALRREMDGRGIKNVDLAELTGWSTSKVSKLLSRKQNFTIEDIVVLARSLGYTLDPFMEQGVSLRGYDVKEFVRSPMTCISDYMEGDENESQNAAVLDIELPLSILGALGVRASDYAVRTHVSSGYQGDEEEKCSWIRIWNRNMTYADTAYPVLSLWIDSHRDRFTVIVYLEGEGADIGQVLYETKIKMRGQHNDYDFLMKEDANDHWIPDHVIDRTLSYDYWGKDFPWPDDDFFLESLGEVFKDYCEIVWEFKHIDLIPEVAIFGNPSKQVQIALYMAAIKSCAFSEETATAALQEKNYQCEVDPSHQSFQTAEGHQYAEAVPLISADKGIYFGKGVMDKANVLCLCPNCAAKLSHGTDEEREEMLIELYRDHKKPLEDAGVKITLGQVLKVHDL